MNEQRGTEQRIREAAFRALTKHGYADLSIKIIGEELGQSPSLIYHYFEDKDELLLSLLDVFSEKFVEKQLRERTGDPEADLRSVVDTFLDPMRPESESVVISSSGDEPAVSSVFIELWAQAARNDAYREKLTEIDTELRDILVRILDSGIEDGTFRDVDTETTAEHILALLLHGMHTRTTTNRDGVPDTMRELIDDMIENDLLRKN
ncbi:TetR/AcrR family transcriptional regulator [Haladaptatus sp.]|uniref:TetR/AcrR family transcriptional regulator n=1 Tax=Haladaptatus sp. TaxID=1973141 RepID=UPI003C3C6DD1